MELREIIAYGTLLALLAVSIAAYRRWRRAVIADRIMRWRTPYSPRRSRRRGYP